MKLIVIMSRRIISVANIVLTNISKASLLTNTDSEKNTVII